MLCTKAQKIIGLLTQKKKNELDTHYNEKETRFEFDREIRIKRTNKRKKQHKLAVFSSQCSQLFVRALNAAIKLKSLSSSLLISFFIVLSILYVCIKPSPSCFQHNLVLSLQTAAT